MEDKEYNSFVDMFQSDGWKLFMEAITELERAITEGVADNATTNDQWQYARGKLHQLRSTMSFENYIKLSYEQKQNEEKEEEDAEDTA